MDSKITKLSGLDKNKYIAKLFSGLKNNHNLPNNVDEFIEYQLEVTGEVWQTNVREHSNLVIVDFILPNLFPFAKSTFFASFFGDKILLSIDIELSTIERLFLNETHKNGINDTLKHFTFEFDNDNQLSPSILYDGANNFNPEDLMRKIIKFIDEAEKVFNLILNEAKTL